MNLHALTKPTGPWLHGLSGAAADVSNAARKVQEGEAPRLAARVVRGTKAKAVADLHAEIAAALQFPLSYGENWDALHDCLCDLAWLGAEEYVLFIADADHLLESASAEDAKRFFAVIQSAIKHWGEPAKGRAARPFHVVLHAAPAGVAALDARCHAAGVTLTWMK